MNQPNDLEKITLTFEAELRKWCLERAFETRGQSGVSHMEVTNVAEDYYRWITEGISQSNRQICSPDDSDEATITLSPGATQ